MPVNISNWTSHFFGLDCTITIYGDYLFNFRTKTSSIGNYIPTSKPFEKTFINQLKEFGIRIIPLRRSHEKPSFDSLTFLVTNNLTFDELDKSIPVGLQQELDNSYKVVIKLKPFGSLDSQGKTYRQVNIDNNIIQAN